jgi:hypothetical protein
VQAGTPEKLSPESATEGNAMRHRLRLFTGTAVEEETSTVSISFGEFRRIVLDAQRVQRTWLRDFDGDTLQVPGDLLDVLTAYRSMLPGA